MFMAPTECRHSVACWPIICGGNCDVISSVYQREAGWADSIPILICAWSLCMVNVNLIGQLKPEWYGVIEINITMGNNLIIDHCRVNIMIDSPYSACMCGCDSFWFGGGHFRGFGVGPNHTSQILIARPHYNEDGCYNVWSAIVCDRVDCFSRLMFAWTARCNQVSRLRLRLKTTFTHRFLDDWYVAVRKFPNTQ